MTNLKTYAAPLEGLTAYPWRKAHREIFGGGDKYFTPFLVANQTHKFKTKELRDISRGEEDLIPQLLTDKAEHFIWAAGELWAMGYEEINLNLGCPSPTVVTRGKGSGMLRDRESLNLFLSQIYEALPDMKISLKTRIGFENKEDWEEILEVFNEYPVHELIIHPRLRSEFYEGKADRDIFRATQQKTSLPLVYNGDISEDDQEALDLGCSLMAGRGLMRNPALLRQLKGGKKASKQELIQFHESLMEGYSEYMSDGAVLQHLKALWIYLSDLYSFEERDMKKMRKAGKRKDYLSAAHVILNGELKYE